MALVAVLHTTRETIEHSVARYADIGVDEMIFLPATDDLDDVARLADIVT